MTVKALRAAVVALALIGGVAACGSDQDPGLTPEGGNDGPSTTSHLLPECPPGGPDASMPAGCLDEDGKLVLP